MTFLCKIRKLGIMKGSNCPLRLNADNAMSDASTAGARLGCRLWIGILLGLWGSIWLAGCSVSREAVNQPNSPIEQLLLSQSIERGLATTKNVLPLGQSVVIETVGFTPSQTYAAAVIAGWLGRQGLQVRPSDDKEARFLVRAKLQAFGIETETRFFGIPAIESDLVPIATPELSIYKSLRRRGLTRLSLDIYDRASGRLVQATPMYEGEVNFSNYTFFFVFTHQSTDIIPPPP